METETRNNNRDKDNRRKIIIILLILILLLLLSIIILLFRLGKRPVNIGQIIDTIVLSPNQEVTQETDEGIQIEEELALHGRVQYSDGTPCPGYTIELHSDVKQAVTDENGNFIFEDVEYGTHKLYIIEEDGSRTFVTDICIDRSLELKNGKMYYNIRKDGTLEFIIPVHTLVLEITINLNKDGTLTIYPESVSAKVADGSIYTVDTDTESWRDKNTTENQTDGSGETTTDTSGGNQETSSENGTVPETTAESVPGSTEASSIKKPGSGSGGSGGSGDSGDSDSTKKVSVLGSDKTTEWTQLTTIDLFKNGEQIAPGTEGEYKFYVKNTYSNSIHYKMTISENAHEAGSIPLVYRLKGPGGYLAGDESTWLTASQMSSVWSDVTYGEAQEYKLEWQWPYERGTTEEEKKNNNAADTALGTADNREHIITVTIDAESY